VGVRTYATSKEIEAKSTTTMVTVPDEGVSGNVISSQHLIDLPLTSSASTTPCSSTQSSTSSSCCTSASSSSTALSKRSSECDPSQGSSDTSGSTTLGHAGASSCARATSSVSFPCQTRKQKKRVVEGRGDYKHNPDKKNKTSIQVPTTPMQAKRSSPPFLRTSTSSSGVSSSVSVSPPLFSYPAISASDSLHSSSGAGTCHDWAALNKAFSEHERLLASYSASSCTSSLPKPSTEG
jgi:hypothetical protein